MTEEVPIDATMILRRYEYGVQSVLSDRMLRGVKARTVVDRAVEMQAYAVTTIFSAYGQRLAEYRAPRDWWQAMKARFAPRWMLRRWPVAETVVEARALYPMLAPPDSVGLGFIRFEKVGVDA